MPSAPVTRIVVGPGRVGRAVGRMPPTPPLYVHRGHPVPDAEGPIYVCTTNEALTQVVYATPPHRRGDLVLFQNGMLLPWMRQQRLPPSTTTVLLYMSAAEDGTVVDGKRTVAYGRWAGDVCSTLRAGGVRCEVVDHARYQQQLVEKLLWASIFWMLSSALHQLPVGRIAREHRQEVKDLVADLLPLAVGYLDKWNSSEQQPGDDMPECLEGSRHQAQAASCHHGSGILWTTDSPWPPSVDQVTDALCAYSQSIAGAVPSFGMAMQEFEWRNGFFLAQAATPVHTRWLQAAGTPAEKLASRWGLQ